MSEKVMLNVRLDEKTEAELQLIQERFECDKTEATRRAIAAFASPPAPQTPALDPMVIEQIRAAVQGVSSLRATVEKLSGTISLLAANQNNFSAEFSRFLASQKQHFDEAECGIVFSMVGLTMLAEKENLITNLNAQYNEWKDNRDQQRAALNE